MKLHQAIKDIVSQKGKEMIANVQIINFLLDYQAFKEKPATKLILRDIINSGYAEEMLALNPNEPNWAISLIKFKRDFVDSYGYRDNLVEYVFDAIVYGIGLRIDSAEPKIKNSINVQSFFDITEENTSEQHEENVEKNNQDIDQSDLYSIALTFYNEGKYKQAEAFIEKAISLFSQKEIPALHLKLKGDIKMKLGYYQEALFTYNASYKSLANNRNCDIPTLLGLLGKHEIKDFENCYFCYYFCLYSLEQVSKEEWLKIVKEEAMNGIDDAIMYCVDNGINPMNDHMNIYFVDRKLLKTGDYLYSDGTFAHELSPLKKVIASVLLTKTSDYEKSQGWEKGYLIPIREDGYSFISEKVIWSNNLEELPFPHSNYTDDDMNHFDEIKTIESEQFIKLSNIDDFPAFKEAENYPVTIPISGTSPWFLPSIHGFKRLSLVFSLWDKYNFISRHLGDYWTSSQADSRRAIHIMTSNNPRGYVFRCSEKTESKLFLPVAAF